MISPQLKQLLLQSLEHERGGVLVYRPPKNWSPSRPRLTLLEPREQRREAAASEVEALQGVDGLV